MALAVLAVVVVAAMPLYIQRPFGAQWSGSSQLSRLSGFGQLEHPTAAAAYWLVVLPVAYAVIAVYLVRRGSSSGVRVRASYVTVCGLVLFLVLVAVVVVVPQLQLPLGNLTIRGLTPLLAIAVGVMVWGVLGRDLTILGIGALALVVSLVANLYNVENMILAQGVDFDYRYNLLLNLALPALVLSIGAVVVAVRDRGPR
ncbi:hypothetical protein [Rhodococcus sp. W8901]|uniref:hypothetical protein n=1 Tax=Rhodococcus sp. W8901 TaxID=2742603 RepID=UPI000E0B6976|nr:hypothetical protein [Rhodococcus sp. W8901]QKT11593.1 hypothetical protein HUN07_13355 [Rhodococcus sp. W8901]